MSTMNLSITTFRPYRSSRWNAVKGCVAEWLHHAASRRELMSLSDRELADVGLTTMDACNETRKPFWRV